MFFLLKWGFVQTEIVSKAGSSAQVGSSMRMEWHVVMRADK